jgi:hypothetical protein
VLRAAYGLRSDRIAEAFQGLGRPGDDHPRGARKTRARDWLDAARHGFRLHLAKADACSAFLSFDRKLARLAATSGAMPVEEP